MKSSGLCFKRVRPLLGTLVEISLRGSMEKQMGAAVSRAFAVIAKIDALMSFHQADSDLSRLNRASVRAWVRVHSHTRTVLMMANKLFEASGGVFDPRCATADRGEIRNAPIEISGQCVRKTGSFTLDLGGIAKGYAVDLAVAVLKRAGIKSGLVNAGGDLRAFGSNEWPIAVRHPAFPGTSLALFPLKNGAMATSGAYFSRRRVNRKWRSAIVSSSDRRSFLKRQSVSVVSSTCMLADGLTKVVALAPKMAVRSLRHFRSQAFIVGPNGVLSGLN